MLRLRPQLDVDRRARRDRRRGKRDGLHCAGRVRRALSRGPYSIEVYQDTAEPTGFPFSRAQLIPKGIVGPYAITGYEDGFSKGLFVVADDSRFALSGYDLVPIGSPDVHRAIAAFAEAGGDLKTIEMFPYAVGGRSCIVVQSSTFSWVYDLGTKWWHERASYGLANWRATRSFNAFGKWLAGDSAGSRNCADHRRGRKTRSEARSLGSVESGPTSAFPERRCRCSSDLRRCARRRHRDRDGPEPNRPENRNPMERRRRDTWSKPIIRKLGAQADGKRGRARSA
jgi:hypothetical protein